MPRGAIRLAVEADLSRIVEMGDRFIRETSYAKHVTANPEQMHSLCRQIISGKGLLICEQDGEIVGMLGFLLFPHFVSGERTAAEVFWWVEPEYRGEGIRLLREAEKLALQGGAKKMQMIAPTERVGALYKRLGYEFVETAYQKAL